MKTNIDLTETDTVCGQCGTEMHQVPEDEAALCTDCLLNNRFEVEYSVHTHGFAS